MKTAGPFMLIPFILIRSGRGWAVVAVDGETAVSVDQAKANAVWVDLNDTVLDLPPLPA